MLALILTIVLSSLQFSIDSLEQAGQYDEAIVQCTRLIEACTEEDAVERIGAEVDLAYLHSLIGHVGEATKNALGAFDDAKHYITHRLPIWLQTNDYEGVAEAGEILQDVVQVSWGALSDCFAAAPREVVDAFLADADLPATAASFKRMADQWTATKKATTPGTPKHTMLEDLERAYRSIWCETVLLYVQSTPESPEAHEALHTLLTTPDLPSDYRLKAAIRLAASHAQQAQYDSALVWMDYVTQHDSAGIYANVIAENRAWIGVQRNDWRTALPLLRQSLETKRTALKNEFLWMTAQTRRRTWVNNYAWYFHQNVSLCALAPHPDSVNAFIYDNVLIEKGLLLSTETELESLLREHGNQAALDSLHALRREMRRANQRQNARMVELEILKQSHTVGDFTRLIDLTYRDVQQQLGEQEVAVEFIVTADADDNRYMQALVMRHDWSAPQLVTIGTIDTLTHLCNLPRLYRMPEVTDLIWQPILQAAAVQPNETIYFAPDGLFYLTGIEYLATEDEGTIFDTYHLVRVSSSRELCRAQRKDSTLTAVLYGGIHYTKDNQTDHEVEYLPATLIEVQALDSILLTDSLFTGDEATEESFMAFSGHAPQVIHIATHGFYIKHKRADNMAQQNVQFVRLTERQKVNIEDYAMARSGLLLAHSASSWTGAQQEGRTYDGVLTAGEIAAMDLQNTEIVVLSACKTGLGDITVDGIAGLQRGFKKAGVHTMMMSLWTVDDNATRLFMCAFYQHLIAGESKLSALRKAQQALRADPDYDHPRFWAAFILLDAI